MKTLVSVAAAAAIGLAGVAATATGASANGWNGGWNGPHSYWGHPHPHYGYAYQGGGGGDGGAIIAGALFGLAAGAIIADAMNQPPHPPAPYQQYAETYADHVAWCRATYTTYDQRGDSWTDFQGGIHQCIEPMR